MGTSAAAALLAFTLPLLAQEWVDVSAVRDLSARVQAISARIDESNRLPRFPPGSSEAQQVYNVLFPHYAEICAVTQYNRKGSAPGGPGGHAVMFINGAEIDSSAGYPKLRLAPEGMDLSGPDSGTGISVNKVFANVHWVAIPGRNTFFRGELAPDQVLDEAAYEAAIRRATEASWFDGIEIHEEYLRDKPAEMPLKEYVVREAIGTDFALNFARSAYCARLPLSREALGKVLANLNAVNEKARREGYDWDALTNNCSHVPHNALAAAGVWDPKKTRGTGPLNQLGEILSSAKAVVGRHPDLSFPSNNFVRLYEAGNERPMSAAAAFRNRDVVRTLEDGWTSTGPGAIISVSPMHDAARNQVFEPGKDPYLFSLPVVWDKEKKFAMLTGDPPGRLADLGANLLHYRERYVKALEGRGKLAQVMRSIDGREKRESFARFYDRYYRHVSRELARTDELLGEYSRLAGAD